MTSSETPPEHQYSLPNQQWWDNCHHKDADERHQWMLTGSFGPEVWKRLNIETLLKPGAKVLNIGVGKGLCTKALVDLGCKVSALDISTHALDKVQTICERTYLHSQLPEMPKNYFDVAISHLVTQHISNAALLEQLRGVIAALTPQGIFGMQFLYYLGDKRFWLADDSVKEQNGGGVGRSLGMMEQLVYQAGGELIQATHLGTYPHYNVGWYSIQITKRQDPPRK